MQFSKKICVLLFLCLCLFIATAFTGAISVVINDGLIINFNGAVFEPKETDGTILQPLTYNERTYLPIRALLEKAGVFVAYDDSAQTVILKSENTLLNRGNLVLHCLKYKDFKQLSSLVHPEKGVTFSPYAYVESTDLNFSAAELAELPDSDKIYVWGSFDGSGHPMELSFSDYYNRFLYSADFINAEKIGNNSIIQTGNTINNIEEAYPGAKFIEYNFSGFKKEYEGMDWASLRLVFEEIDNEWYLIGIIHDNWTT